MFDQQPASKCSLHPLALTLGPQTRLTQGLNRLLGPLDEHMVATLPWHWAF